MMAMEPCDYFQGDLFIHGDNSHLWALSPEFQPYDAFPDLMMQEVEASSELSAPPPPPMAHQSAFRSFSRPECQGLTHSKSPAGGAEGMNIHRRVIDALRRLPTMRQEAEGSEVGGSKGVETSRGFRHMMRERQRREKLSQSYADLYSMVSFRSKSDKNSIVQSASAYVRELKGVKESLQQRNEKLKATILGCSNGGSKIKIEVSDQHSSIDSMIGALRCLRSMNVKVKAMRSDLSNRKISAIMSIDTKIATADVERAVGGALMEVEKKLRCQFPGTNRYSEECLVQNAV